MWVSTPSSRTHHLLLGGLSARLISLAVSCSHKNPPTCSLTPQKNCMPPLCARNGHRRIQPDTTLFDPMHWKIRRHFGPNDTYRRIVLIRDGAIHNESDAHIISIFSYK